MSAADAHAGWGSSGGSSGWSGYSSGSSGGGSGSSGGSWSSSGGSSGGSSGSHGGGGLLARLRARRASHSSGGSWGSSGGSSSSSSSSWGSSGGSSSSGHYHYSHGSWGSSGGSSSSGYYSSHGSWGSSGGSSGGYIVDGHAPANGGYYDATPSAPADDSSVMPPADGTPTPPDDPGMPPTPPSARADSGVLTVSVPADARVFVNGKATSSTGAVRHYVSRGLRNGYKYAYEVRVEMVRDGRTIEDVKTIELRAGETNYLAFDANRPADVTTTLTLKVPQGAKVTLAGAETASTGAVRVFSTDQLAAGQAWSDYQVQVAWEQNGRTLVKEQTITLTAGESRTLEFASDEAKVASAQ
jgi:uncharacterized protein (TIGR03000 family)